MAMNYSMVTSPAYQNMFTNLESGFGVEAGPSSAFLILEDF